MAQEGRPRMHAFLVNQGQGQGRWSTVQGNVPRNSDGINRHCRNVGQGEILKYLRKRLSPPY